MKRAVGLTLALGALTLQTGCQSDSPVTVQPPVSSSLKVSTVTTGGAFDADGFRISIDGAAPALQELNEAVTIDRVTEGSHTVELSGMSSNCSVTGGSSRTITVAKGMTAGVEFTVACTPPSELASIRILFARSVGSRADGFRSRIVAMNADGSAPVQLTSGAFNDYGPDVSPDGRRIAFMGDRDGDQIVYDPDIFVMNADGSGTTRLVAGPAYDPDWSPDGRKIAFSMGGGMWGGPISVMHADGSGAVPLTGPDPFPEDAWPAWSPDGARIAFTRAEFPAGTHNGIWIMKADGTGAARLTEPRMFGGAFPVWSPDGRIAFSDAEGYLMTSRIKVMKADGSAVATVLESDVQLIAHDWSADGKMLLFTKDVRGRTGTWRDIHLLRLDDGTIVRLTAGGASNQTPAFLPSERSPAATR